VGSHPASESPFGLQDTTGNVYELTYSRWTPGEPVLRGGAWYYDRASVLLVNRTGTEVKARDLTVGLRLCADVPPRRLP